MTAPATTPKSVLEKRTELAQQMHAMVEEGGKREVPGLTAEEDAQFNRMDDELLKLDKFIAQQHRAEELAKQAQGREERIERAEYTHNPKTADERPSYREQRSALGNFFAAQPLNDRQTAIGREMGFSEVRGSLNLGRQTINYDGAFCVRMLPQAPKSVADLRENFDGFVTRATTTAQTITTSGGGHTIQNEAMRALEVALLQYGGMRVSGARVWRTQTGATLPVPTLNDTTNVSVVLAINTAADVEALVFGQKTFTAFKYTTKQVLVPMELSQDTTLALESTISEAFGVRAARGTNNHFTVGVATDSQPTGVVTDSIAGTSAADVNSFTYSNLVDLEHSVDPAWRADPTCKFMFHDGVLKVAKKLLDGQSRPIWLPAMSGLAGGFPDTLLGYPYIINQDMPTIATATTGTGAKKIMLFGAFGAFVIRDVQDMMVLRLVERYAEKAQVGYVAFHRHDSGTVIAATDTPPIKHMLSKAT